MQRPRGDNSIRWVRKNTLLTYGVILECNGFILKASGVVASYIDELLSHRAETGGIDAGLGIIQELKNRGCKFSKIKVVSDNLMAINQTESEDISEGSVDRDIYLSICG